MYSSVNSVLSDLVHFHSQRSSHPSDKCMLILELSKRECGTWRNKRIQMVGGCASFWKSNTNNRYVWRSKRGPAWKLTDWMRAGLDLVSCQVWIGSGSLFFLLRKQYYPLYLCLVYVGEGLAYMYVCAPCVCPVLSEATSFLGSESWMVMNCPVGAGNWACVLIKNRKCA